MSAALSPRVVAGLVLLAFAFSSAHAHQSEHPPETWTVYQRSTTVLPGTANALRVALGDITRGQVRARILDGEDQMITGARLHEGEHLHFTHLGHAYVLHLVRLENFILGNDRATLALSRTKGRSFT